MTETMKSFALGSVITLGAFGVETGREMMLPQFDHARVENNLKTAKENETIKQFVTLHDSGKIYRVEADSGIKKDDYSGSGWGEYDRGDILRTVDRFVTEITDANTGEKVAMLYRITNEGVEMTYQRIDSRGNVLEERVSRLVPVTPNVYEK